MKKLLLSVTACVSMIAASFTFANTAPVEGYSSKQVPGTSLPTQRSFGGPVNATNIVIINFSKYFVHAIIPGTSVDQPIYSGGTGIINHPTYAGNTRVQILDGANRSLFDMSLCHYSIVTVDEGPTVFRLNTNDRYC